MLETIAFFLRSGIKVSLSLAAGLVILSQLNAHKVKRYLWAGIASSFASGLALAHLLKFVKVREEFDAAIALLVLLLVLGLFVFMYRRSNNERVLSVGVSCALSASRFILNRDLCSARTTPTATRSLINSLCTKILFFSLGFLPVLQDFIEIALFPKSIFVTAKSYLNTELVLKVGACLLGIGISIFIGQLFVRISRFLDRGKTLFLIFIFFLSIAIQSLITLASSLLVLGFLPTTAKTVAIIAPLVNYRHLVFYAILLMLGAGLIFTRMRKSGNGFNNILKLNPAERRKRRAALLVKNYWVRSGYLSIAVVIAFTSLDYMWANRKISLSPAEEVIPKDGLIYIPVSSVNDGRLHRFAFSPEEGLQVRFIAVEKRNGVFGVCLDACEICGPRGYYEKKKGEILCLACGVMMNLDTIGLKGGCNPIPLSYRNEKDFLLIQTTDLMAKKEKFRK